MLCIRETPLAPAENRSSSPVLSVLSSRQQTNKEHCEEISVVRYTCIERRLIEVRDATQNFPEFEYTAQTISATKLRR
jgi:hypothetical protein